MLDTFLLHLNLHLNCLLCNQLSPVTRFFIGGGGYIYFISNINRHTATYTNIIYKERSWGWDTSLKSPLYTTTAYHRSLFLNFILRGSL